MKASFSPHTHALLLRVRNTVGDFLSTHKYWIFVLISAYCIADLLILTIYPYLLTAQGFHHSPPAINKSHAEHPLREYVPIWDFNVFHDGAIPPTLSSLQKNTTTKTNQPVRSALPLTLNGTIVHQKPLYSIANITVKSQNKSINYYTQDKIESLARIITITSDRVYLMNLTNSKKEYIEISDLPNISLQFREKKPHRRDPADGVFSVKPFHSRVDRSFINKHLRVLPEILQQATVVPHWEKGEMVGYRFKHIEPGSPYEKLGFRVSDIIKSVEGERVRSELQAAEMFHRLKHSSKLNMTLQRDGEDIPFSWTVNEDASIEDTSNVKFR